ncbi:hypothetical protein LSG31_01760 [Fodinisporobacter ferrooxydans]|uniref:protein acetyllysine N-acetyltransferase n=1 Tax=Fodinisporobacter ferrooxydans TaxID=2901836 RepID=A0ABY4CKJ7_9BACL|nr:hypothetical protein LSG31_01760 [Alicyclobacillaceae bacterium MYW30-H2]
MIQGIITQNVDGFHQRAGSKKVYELHGSINQLACLSCNRKYPSKKYLEEDGSFCECGGFLRPTVVLFGEELPKEAVQHADGEVEKADLFIVLGSSLQVSPANYYPIKAKKNRVKLVIVNIEPTEMDGYADLVINNRKIGDVLQEVNKELVG